jgi:hypothetical protein
MQQHVATVWYLIPHGLQMHHSGCDFVSLFKGYGKKTFLDIFRKHAAFITGSQYTGHLNEVNTDGGMYLDCN